MCILFISKQINNMIDINQYISNYFDKLIHEESFYNNKSIFFGSCYKSAKLFVIYQ